MPSPADLVVTNQSNASVTIQTHAIAAAASYTVSFADFAAWATDPYLRIYLLTGVCYLTILGKKMGGKEAADWMDKMAAGTIVFAS